MTQSGELDRLAEEQAALREIAAVLARGAPPDELFATVAEQVARVLHVPVVRIVRYEDDEVASECASYSEAGEVFPVGSRLSLDGTNVVRMVLETRAAARINDYTGLGGQMAELVREHGIRSSVGVPILVAGRLWGAMVVSSTEADPLDPGTEARLAEFTELVATAIANTEARTQLERLAEEQAALRRVATLVAQDASQSEVFTAVAREVGLLLVTDVIRMVRYDDDRTAVVVASSGHEDHFPVGYRLSLEVDTAVSRVSRTGRPVRIDDYDIASGTVPETVRSMGIRSVVGTPIWVEGRLWGAMTAGTPRAEPLPPDTESRLGQFTALIATAIANTESRPEVGVARGGADGPAAGCDAGRERRVPGGRFRNCHRRGGASLGNGGRRDASLRA